MDLQQELDQQQDKINNNQKQIDDLILQCKNNVHYQKNFKESVMDKLSANFQKNLNQVQNAQLQQHTATSDNFDEKVIDMLIELQDLRTQSDAISNHNIELTKYIENLKIQCQQQLQLYQQLSK